MSAHATFSMQSFLRDEDSSRYASTMNSLYCIVSIAVYAVLAMYWRGKWNSDKIGGANT